MISWPITEEEEEEQAKEESRKCMLRGEVRDVLRRGMKQVEENHNENEVKPKMPLQGSKGANNRRNEKDEDIKGK
jgi:hypothetical protein